MYKVAKYLVDVDVSDNLKALMNMRNQQCVVIAKEKYNKLLNIEKNTDIYAEPWIKTLIKKEFVIDREKDETKWIELLHNKVIYGDESMFVEIMPTNDCNFRCSYCFETPKSHFMSKNVEENVIRFFEQQVPRVKNVRLAWFGGEPLLCVEQVVRMSKRINEICRKNNVPLLGEMSTNGYLLTAEVISKLVKYRVLQYQICLDGTEKEHNKTRPHYKNKDSYERIVSNLLDIKRNVKGKNFTVSIRINMTPDKEKEVSESIEKLSVLFADDERFRFKVQYVRNWGGERISNDLIAEETGEKYKDIYLKAEKSGFKTLDHTSFAPVVGYCVANRKNGYGINYDGSIYKCALAMYNDEHSDINRVGYIDDKGRVVIDQWKEAVWLVNNKVKEKCQNCSIYPFCMGGHCFYQKNIVKKDNCNIYLRKMIQAMLISKFNRKEIDCVE